jgi:hypothetical protein
VRNRLRAIPLAVDLSFPDPDAKDETMVMDQVIVDDGTTIRRGRQIACTNNVPQLSDAVSQPVWILSPIGHQHTTVPYVQVRQPLQVLLVRESDLEKNAPAPSAGEGVPIALVYNIALTANNQTEDGAWYGLSHDGEDARCSRSGPFRSPSRAGRGEVSAAERPR